MRTSCFSRYLIGPWCLQQHLIGSERTHVMLKNQCHVSGTLSLLYCYGVCCKYNKNIFLSFSLSSEPLNKLSNDQQKKKLLDVKKWEGSAQPGPPDFQGPACNKLRLRGLCNVTIPPLFHDRLKQPKSGPTPLCPVNI